MLRMRKNRIAAILGLFLSLTAQAQSPVIDGFRAVQVGADVQLNWFIPQGLSCIDMQVQRSEDSLNWQTVNTVFGLCGSDLSDQPYDYRDRGPAQGSRRLWYRIYASNGTVVSEVLALFYKVFSPGELFIAPNPMGERGIATFSSLSGENLVLEWLDQQGRLRRSSDPSGSGEFILQRGDLESGTYWLRVRSTNGETRATRALVLP
jgi:hypothetical protein